MKARMNEIMPCKTANFFLVFISRESDICRAAYKIVVGNMLFKKNVCIHNMKSCRFQTMNTCNHIYRNLCIDEHGYFFQIIANGPVKIQDIFLHQSIYVQSKNIVLKYINRPL